MDPLKTIVRVMVASLCAFAPALLAHAADGEEAKLVTDPELAQEPSDYFGGTASGFSSYFGQAFQQRVRGGGNVFSFCEGADEIYWNSGDPTAVLQLDVPNGARLQGLRWWARDTDTAQDVVLQLRQICMPSQAAGAPVVTIIGSQSTLGSAGFQSNEIIPAAPLTADTKTCTYSVLATFGNAHCGLALFKVRAQWVRQVSPAPTTARFLDVPANHPFFRFVEALASSGITGGCSANQYCPDAAVTRGQMAVFLATALGLNWGGL